MLRDDINLLREAVRRGELLAAIQPDYGPLIRVLDVAEAALPKTEKRWGVKLTHKNGYVTESVRSSNEPGLGKYMPYSNEVTAREFAGRLIQRNDTRSVEVFEFDYEL